MFQKEDFFSYIAFFHNSHFNEFFSNSCYVPSYGSLVRSQLVSLKYFIDINTFRSLYGPGVDSASNRSEYQEHFPGVKTAERIEEFKCLGTTLTNQNSIAEEIKSRLRSGNACYYSVQKLLSSSLLSKNLKIKI